MTLKVESFKPSEIKAYSRNARLHSPEQIDQICASIREFGFTNPILVTTSLEIVAGHGRLEAALQMGLDEVPCIRLGHLSDAQAKQLRIADNQIALNSTWDIDLLASELVLLDDEGFDLDVLAFDDDFLAGLLADDDDGVMPAEPSGPEEMAEAAESVEVLVGPYKLKLKKRHWDKWETAMRAAVGFDPSDIESEIRKRLGFKE